MKIKDMMAAAQHVIWSNWMKHLFRQGIFNEEDGSWTMPKSCVDRWTRQMNTDYANLTKEEQESDMDQVERMLNME